MQIVQKRCVTSPHRIVRVQRLCISNGDDHQSQAEQIYYRRGKSCRREWREVRGEREMRVEMNIKARLNGYTDVGEVGRSGEEDEGGEGGEGGK